MKKYVKETIIEKEFCKAFLYSCACCVKIELKSVVWQFNFESFLKFKSYIEQVALNGFEGFQKKNKCYIIGLNNTLTYMYLEEELMDDFLEILEKIEIRLYREKFTLML